MAKAKEKDQNPQNQNAESGGGHAADAPPEQAEARVENSKPDQAPDLQSQLNAAKEQLLRALADSENLRKRVEKEKEDVSKYALSGFARDLLNVADNLQRAIAAVKKEEAETNPALRNLVFGIEMTQKEMQSVLDKHGVKKIEPKIGDAFDYNAHQAMMEIEDPTHPPGTVLQLLQPGYRLHDRLLRPALVGVAKAAPEGDAVKVDVKA